MPESAADHGTGATGPVAGRLRPLYARFRGLLGEVTKFGIVGTVNFLVDIGIYNLCESAFGLGPLTSKTISVSIATTSAFFGNRYWTWRNRPRTNLAREYVLYFVMNAIGLGIALACLGFTYYVLGHYWPRLFQTALANNLSGNIVGNALGTLFRFWAYRRWVFVPLAEEAVEPATAGPTTESGSPTEYR
ncbi:MAG: GtrA family protein [Actinocatenispora sp.]